MKKIICMLCSMLCAVELTSLTSYAAITSRKQSAIQNGTSVRVKVEAKGLYNQDCYDAYYGCMDQFCITDNTSGGSCACSDDITKYEKELNDIQATLIEADRIRTEEVEKVKAGANADIIFAGRREYDDKGNVKTLDKLSDKTSKEKRRLSLEAIFNNAFTEEDDTEFSTDLIADQTGSELFASAEQVCMAQIPESCDKDVRLLRQMYSRQIVSDCTGLKNSIATQKAKADLELLNANNELRAALKESFDDANKYNQGECMVEFKKCMQKEDACGTNWVNCVSTIASENMQNKKAKSTKNTKVATVDVYNFTPSTMEMLESKRIICERVLDQCIAVRDLVWPAFLRESAPSIKLAESMAESNFRQSCLGTISNCIHKACKDDIAGKGVETLDACLARPTMARSFCKVEIDPCERMEPQIWEYVVDKLAAMRVDACTAEVKECFTDETRCGANFQNCLGMDYNFIHDICPIDKLVVCKQSNPNFSMSDLDSMLMGLYLNIDNTAMEQCQRIVDAKMQEICGSTTDCNRFAADDTLGTGSLRSQKIGDLYRVTGMISFGSIKMGYASSTVSDGNMTLAPGQIGVDEYITQVRNRFGDTENADAIIPLIEEELNTIAANINRTIELIEQDPEILFCTTGRDLTQITGRRGTSTTGRFPNLLNRVKLQIAIAALRHAQDNYNTKFNEMVTQASKDSSADIAQYLCQMMPVSGGAPIGANITGDTQLTPPYAISYDVGTGLVNNALAQGGRGTSNASGVARMTTDDKQSTATEIISAIWSAGMSTTSRGGRVTQELPSGTREMWSSFDRDTRTCHFCTSTITKNCNSLNKKGFWGIGAQTSMECTESAPVEKCEDLKM